MAVSELCFDLKEATGMSCNGLRFKHNSLVSDQLYYAQKPHQLLKSL